LATNVCRAIFSFIDYNIFQSIQFEASTEDSLEDSVEECCGSEEEDISASALDEYSEILDKLISCALESADEIADASLEVADEMEEKSSAEEAALLTSSDDELTLELELLCGNPPLASWPP
jgi:hypothetical protein